MRKTLFIIIPAFICILTVVLFYVKQKEIITHTKKIGIVRNATVISTAFHAQTKIQIKTDNLFFVVVGSDDKIPQIILGDSLTGLFSGSELMYIVDSRNVKFKVK